MSDTVTRTADRRILLSEKGYLGALAPDHQQSVRLAAHKTTSRRATSCYVCSAAKSSKSGGLGANLARGWVAGQSSEPVKVSLQSAALSFCTKPVIA